jgi:hypothetical protein
LALALASKTARTSRINTSPTTASPSETTM